MNKTFFLLPKLAWNTIRKNSIVYLPYLLTTAFGVAVFFIFSTIIDNKMLQNVPNAAYAMMLLEIGKVLLGIILIPFLFYTNSFLIKRRKKELGLYSVLGLEKKHIGTMLVIESFIIYVASLALGFLSAMVFSKLIFLFMLRIAGLPTDVSFTMQASNFTGTMIFFGIVTMINLITNLWQVGMANPMELLKSGKQGEKEPKHPVLVCCIGVLTIGLGYFICATTSLEGGYIFLQFPVAVLLVVIGTYCLFTTGIVLLLKIMKKNKRFYYNKKHYVLVSGMLYRMKKSAAGLSNICVFSTMIIITVMCTVSLTIGQKGSIQFNNPFDVHFWVSEAVFQPEDCEQIMPAFANCAMEQGTIMEDAHDYHYGYISRVKEGNELRVPQESDYNTEDIRVMSVKTYNQITKDSLTLEGRDDIYFYTSTADWNLDTIVLDHTAFHVKKELSDFCISPKEPAALVNRMSYLIVCDDEMVDQICAGSLYHGYELNLRGKSSDCEKTVASMQHFMESFHKEFHAKDIFSFEKMARSMNGGLLFIGIFFGILFMVCLVLIMYYKQISEGLEDQDQYHIMKKVGMSDQDIKVSIRKQILWVFLIPLVTAVIHTFASLNMTIKLLNTLNLFNIGSMLIATALITLIFTCFYAMSYFMTAKTYYKLVR